MSEITFHARQCEFKYLTAATIVSSTKLEDVFSAGTAFSGHIKDVSISPPEGDVEVVNFLGETSGFQNQKFELKPFSEASISGTLVVDSDEILESLAYGSGTASASGYTRYRVGDGNRVNTGAILALLNNGTDEVAVVLDNLYITKLGDLSPTGTDGHWEIEFSAKCLAKDFYIEFKD